MPANACAEATFAQYAESEVAAQPTVSRTGVFFDLQLAQPHGLVPDDSSARLVLGVR
jgi:hypothetical protein